MPQTLALTYGRYLCRSWRESHPDGPALSTFILYFQIEISQPPGALKDVETQQAWSHDCFG